VTFTSPDSRTIRVNPHLQDLDYIHGSVPTREGPVEVTIERGHAPEIKLPDGVQLAH
jgi:hypothetical protein